MGKPSRLQKRIYNTVLKAQELALQSITPGCKAKEIDQIARKVIAEAGWDKFFGHGLGHGVGLAVHESPVLNSQSNEILQPGMVHSVEPGIYLPKIGGVRIEDVIVIDHHKIKNLTTAPKELIELYGNCIATVFASLYEDLGMVALESMAAGKPVIASGDKGFRETVIDKKTGLLIKPTVENIIKAVEWMTPERAKEMRKACEERAKDFSEEKFIEGIRKAIEEVRDGS